MPDIPDSPTQGERREYTFERISPTRLAVAEVAKAHDEPERDIEDRVHDWLKAVRSRLPWWSWMLIRAVDWLLDDLLGEHDA